jgi:hypothetical protein
VAGPTIDTARRGWQGKLHWLGQRAAEKLVFDTESQLQDKFYNNLIPPFSTSRHDERARWRGSPAFCTRRGKPWAEIPRSVAADAIPSATQERDDATRMRRKNGLDGLRGPSRASQRACGRSLGTCQDRVAYHELKTAGACAIIHTAICQFAMGTTRFESPASTSSPCSNTRVRMDFSSQPDRLEEKGETVSGRHQPSSLALLSAPCATGSASVP